MSSNSTRKKRNLYYWLNVIFFLFTLGPVAGFVYLGVKYGFLHDTFIKPFLVGVLFYSLIGFTVLRKIFDKVTTISKEISHKIKTDIPGVDFDGSEDERDRQGQILIARVGDRCVGGARIAPSTPIPNQLAELALTTEDCCMWERFVIDPVVRTVQLVRDFCAQLIDTSRRCGYDFALVLSSH